MTYQMKAAYLKVVTAVAYNLLALPTYTFEESSCDVGGQTYSARFRSNADLVNSTVGNVRAIEPGYYEVTDIPIGQEPTLTLTRSDSGCENTAQMTSPTEASCNPCNGNQVPAPTSDGDQFVCTDDDTSPATHLICNGGSGLSSQLVWW